MNLLVPLSLIRTTRLLFKSFSDARIFREASGPDQTELQIRGNRSGLGSAGSSALTKSSGRGRTCRGSNRQRKTGYREALDEQGRDDSLPKPAPLQQGLRCSKACDERYSVLVFLKVSRFFEGLRADLRTGTCRHGTHRVGDRALHQMTYEPDASSARRFTIRSNARHGVTVSRDTIEPL
jgi:hypothetical protein